MSEFLETLRQNCTERATFELDGKTHRYLVISPSIEPNLPGFCGIADKVLFISKDVDPRYREYILGHESECKLSGGGGYTCKEALVRELERVPEEIRAGYIEARLRFFENLLRYYVGKKVPREGFTEGLSESLDYLRCLVD